MTRVNRVLKAGLGPALAEGGFEQSAAETRTWYRRHDRGVDFVWVQLSPPDRSDSRSFRVEPKARIEALADQFPAAPLTEPPQTSCAVPWTFRPIGTPIVGTTWEVFDGCDMEAVAASLDRTFREQALPWLDRFHSYEGTIENLSDAEQMGWAALLAYRAGEADRSVQFFDAHVRATVSPFDSEPERERALVSLAALAEQMGRDPSGIPGLFPAPLSTAAIERVLDETVGPDDYALRPGHVVLVVVEAEAARVTEALAAAEIDPRFVRVSIGNRQDNRIW